MIRTQEYVDSKKQSAINLDGLTVYMVRTTRVPEGKVNSLPAGLGQFPLYSVGDFKSGCPGDWHEDCYFMPMYTQEAMWMNFRRAMDNPCALIVGAGNINAVTGKPFETKLKTKKRNTKDSENLDIKLEKEQNYLVIPPQPWLDGWKDKDNKIYQFVAAEMGSGETVEGQVTGEETVGGIQLVAYKPKPGKELIQESRPREYISAGGLNLGSGDLLYESCTMKSSSAARGRELRLCSPIQTMGLGKGGEIEQKIYPDTYGFDVWDEKPAALTKVYLVSSADFKQITGVEAPPTPVSYKDYQKQGLHWFDLHDQKLKDTKGSDIFSKLKPVTGKKGKPTKI